MVLPRILARSQAHLSQPEPETTTWTGHTHFIIRVKRFDNADLIPFRRRAATIRRINLPQFGYSINHFSHLKPRMSKLLLLFLIIYDSK